MYASHGFNGHREYSLDVGVTIDTLGYASESYVIYKIDHVDQAVAKDFGNMSPTTSHQPHLQP